MKRRPTRDARFSIRLPANLLAELKFRAQREGRSVADYICRLLVKATS